MTRTMFVIHEPGNNDGGARWRTLDLQDGNPPVGWRIEAPDLPGHGTAPLPVGGSYDMTSPCFEAIRAVMNADAAPEVLVGVGTSGWAAQLLRLAGYGERLVLIDGLGAPWQTGEQRSNDRRQRLRNIASDPAALANWEPGTSNQSVDPRLRHGLAPHGSVGLAAQAAAATPGPVLIITTNGSADGPDTATQSVVASFVDATAVDASSSAATDVIAAIVRWLSDDV